MLENPRGERRSFSRRKLIGANGYEQVGGSGGGMGVGTTLAIAVLLVAAVAFMISTIVLASETHTPPPPPIFTARTVPQNVNDFYLEFFQRSQLTNNTYPTIDSFDCRTAGGKYCYGKKPRDFVAALYHIDDPSSWKFETLYKEFHDRHFSLLNTNQMSNAQKNTISQQFGRESRADNWLIGGGTTPKECQELLRDVGAYYRAVVGYGFLPWAPVYEIFFGFGELVSNDGTLPHDHPYAYPIIDEPSFEYHLGMMYAIADRLKRTREEDFYMRNAMYMQNKYGVGYSLVSAEWEIYNIVEDLLVFFDSSSLGGFGTSSLAELTMLIRAIDGGYISSMDFSALHDAITAVDEEIQVFVPWAINQFVSVIPMFDDYASCPPSLISATVPSTACWFHQYHGTIRANNPEIDAICSTRKQLENEVLRDPEDGLNRIKSEWLTHRAVAETWLDANVGDWLGYNLTWVHVFFGTEANVTELGWHEPTHCPTDTKADPFYAEVREARIEGKTALRRFLGNAAGPTVYQDILFGTFFGGCDDSFGNAFVEFLIPFNNTGIPLATHLGPLQPRGVEWHVDVHEQHHVDQVGNMMNYCPDCFFYASQIYDPGNRPDFGTDRFQSVEGAATWVEVFLTRSDTRAIPPGSFRDAMSSLDHILIRWETPYSVLSPVAGLETTETAASFVQENSWFPSATWEEARDFIEIYQKIASFNGAGFHYPMGAIRYLRLAERVQTECPDVPEAHKRVRDINILLPAMPATSQEIAIDEYIASGCTHFPYELRF